MDNGKYTFTTGHGHTITLHDGDRIRDINGTLWLVGLSGAQFYIGGEQRGRDPERIHTIMVALEALWQERSDVRFGQLIANLFGGRDQFYTGDDVILALIERAHQTPNADA